MLKKYLFAAIIFCMPTVHASNLYLRGFAGLNCFSRQSLRKAKIASGYAVGGAIGYAPYQCLRLEAEGTYRKNTITHGEITSFSGMGNLFLDVPLGPYVGAGLGAFHTQAPNETLISRDALKRCSPAYQLIAGLTLLPLPKLQTTLEYHYLETLSHSNRNHTLATSVRLSF